MSITFSNITSLNETKNLTFWLKLSDESFKLPTRSKIATSLRKLKIDKYEKID
jgi:hypothetical protein